MQQAELGKEAAEEESLYVVDPLLNVSVLLDQKWNDETFGWWANNQRGSIYRNHGLMRKQRLDRMTKLNQQTMVDQTRPRDG